MSGVGFFELVILFMIGLVVLGPQRLPKVANQLGTWIGQARRIVITSYSIHYTKLYEIRGSAPGVTDVCQH